jgi:hypothetical protein
MRTSFLLTEKARKTLKSDDVSSPKTSGMKMECETGREDDDELH